MPTVLLAAADPVPRETWFVTWYHTFVLCAGAGCLFLPLVSYVYEYLRYRWLKHKARPLHVAEREQTRVLAHLEAVRTEPFWPQRDVVQDKLYNAGYRFALYLGRQERRIDALRSLDIAALPLDAPKRVIATCDPSAVILAYFDLQALDSDGPRRRHDDRLAIEVVSRLDQAAKTGRHTPQGVLLVVSDVLSSATWVSLCHHLHVLNLLVFLQVNPDEKHLHGLDLQFCDGIVIQNGAIMPNGDRRTFFQGFELRDIIARCARQKALRPHFTTILNDPSALPTVPILRRAFKFTRFHEVLLTSCGLNPTKLAEALPRQEPYSAFDWLKRPDVMDFHRQWLSADVDLIYFPRQGSHRDIDLDPLDDQLPGLGATFFRDVDTPWELEAATIHLMPPDWTVGVPVRESFFATGRRGQQLAQDACYALRDEVEPCHVDAVRRTQRHMRDLRLNQEITILQKQQVFEHFGDVANDELAGAAIRAQEFRLFQDLVSGIKSGLVVVMEGLDTGFTLPDGRFHLWGVSEQEGDKLYLYVSLKAKDLPAIILHTFLVSRGVTRRRAFEIELLMTLTRPGAPPLPPRVQDELESSTKSELVEYVQQIRLSRDSDTRILRNVVDEVERLLLDETTRQAWKKIHGEGYLSGATDTAQLYEARLGIWRQQGLDVRLNVHALRYMHEAIEVRIIAALRDCDAEAIDLITSSLTSAYPRVIGRNKVSIEADLFGLMVLCAFRRIAVDETYVEATDRCPIFHFQEDQPGVFSELWVIGSQCDSYFDVGPSALGKMHYHRYRAALAEHPPDPSAWNGVDVFTAYHKIESPTPEGEIAGGKDIENPLDRMSGSKYPRLQKFAYLSVFCLPATVDVLMLAYLGRGLFQTAFMTGEEVTFATIGLLTALLLCSGTIGWIGSSGGYYLYNAAFDSMVHLMVQKLSGAIALVLSVGLLGFLGIGLQQGWYAGLIFFLYLFVVATYLNLLGILATMHRDGSPFPSGRTILWQTIPFMLLSPIVTMFVHNHDVLIYLVTLYIFLAIVYLRFRKLTVVWSQWYAMIHCASDAQVVAWYREQHGGGKEVDVPYETCRAALALAVQQERDKPSATAAALVKQLAPGRDYAKWLLQKDAGPGGVVPDAFSPAWNNQIKMSLTTYQNFVRGLKEHSGFLQFRYAKADIGWNVVVFLAALLDRWISITMSAAGDGPLPLYDRPGTRYSIAFALFYFLSSAIALDFQCQYCWAALAATPTELMTSAGSLDRAEAKDNHRRRIMFYGTLRSLLSMMSMFFGIACIMHFFFVDTPLEIGLFFAYCGAYTFVLLVQYVRVFVKDTNKAVLVLGSCITVVYLVGVVVHLIPAIYNFLFLDVFCLAAASALGTAGLFCIADFGSDRGDMQDYNPQEFMEKTGWKTHSQKSIGLQSHLDAKLRRALDDQDGVPWAELEKSAFVLESTVGTFLSHAVLEALENTLEDKLIMSSFPNWRWLLDDVQRRWRSGSLVVHLVEHETFVAHGLPCSALARHVDEQLHVYVLVSLLNIQWLESSAQLVGRTIAEAMVHEVCECIHGMPHWRAVLAELMVANDRMPARIGQQLHADKRDQVERLVLQTGSELMSRICLRIDLDHQWVALSEELRRFVVQRLIGCESQMTARVQQHLLVIDPDTLSFEQVVRNFDLAIALVQKVDAKARDILKRNFDAQASVAPAKETRHFTGLVHPKSWHMRLYDGLYTAFKYVAVISVGDPDFPREFVWASKGSSFRYVGRFVLLHVWQVCAALRRQMVELTLLHSRPELQEILNLCRYGIERRITKDHVMVNDPFGPLTGFMTTDTEAGRELALEVYKGALATKPADKKDRQFVAYYDELERLVRMQQFKGEEMTSESRYEYEDNARVPYVRATISPHKVRTFYDENARVLRGTRVVDGKEWTFDYVYAADPKSRVVHKATFTTGVDLHLQVVTVYWCMPTDATPREEDLKWWTSTDKVMRYRWTTGTEEWDCGYFYRHKRDPAVVCTYRNLIRGMVHKVDKMPPWMEQDKAGFRKRPAKSDFGSEDLLFHHPALDSTWRRFAHAFSWAGTRTVHTPLSTGELRTILWSRWHKSKTLDGVVCCFIDEQILRNEPLLHPYWQLRDAGRLRSALTYLKANVDNIIAAIDIADDVSQNTFLPYKIGDLLTMGTGGTSNYKTRTLEDNFTDTYDRLSIMFLDTGCFPDQPGGVSNCRRDLVNGHTTIRNHVFTESASDFGVPRYQVERNIQSMKVLPMWGLDYLSPYHGLLDNLLDSQVAYREQHTTQADIKTFFVPLIRKLVRGARSRSYNRAEIEEYTQTFVDLSMYFEEKDYLKSWRSKHTIRAWRKAWLEDCPNATNLSEYFEIEKPTIGQLDEAMELWRRYFFVFSVRIPEEVPTVFQCTHHGVASLYGMLLKLRRGTAYHIWDHAIYWRESCLNISSSQCILPLAVQNMLLGGIKLASHLAYTHADVVLPCTNLFNPGWEMDIGSGLGTRMDRHVFDRKIDPVVNGISDMERFEPVEKVGTTLPTVMMLSNVQFIKDVKNAVYAADIIVNRFGFKKYQLVIYGALDRTPQYTAETEAIIRKRKLEDNVKLAGFGNPKEILRDAWAFMNSSLSEGLPLAIGEAALSGAPIIATDVGATALVISDPADPKTRYGEIVPPNDSLALARAQIQILSMLGPWTRYTGDSPPALPENFTPQDVDWITKRMYDKTPERRALGLKGRETVLHSFNGNRYLREHEQMYWLGSYRSKQRNDPLLLPSHGALVKLGDVPDMTLDLREPDSSLWKNKPWHHFEDRGGVVASIRKRLVKRPGKKQHDGHIVEITQDANSLELGPVETKPKFAVIAPKAKPRLAGTARATAAALKIPEPAYQLAPLDYDSNSSGSHLSIHEVDGGDDFDQALASMTARRGY